MDKLLAFVGELDRRGIARRLDSVREGAVMVEVYVPGQRWEVEFFADGSVEVEAFRAAEGVLGGAEAEEAIARLLREEDDWDDRQRDTQPRRPRIGFPRGRGPTDEPTG